MTLTIDKEEWKEHEQRVRLLTTLMRAEAAMDLVVTEYQQFGFGTEGRAFRKMHGELAAWVALFTRRAQDERRRLVDKALESKTDINERRKQKKP